MAPSVLVVCAMESEAVHLRQRLTDAEEVPSPAAAWPISRGSLHGAEVSVLVCGVGEANAAGATAAVLAGGWRPRAVLNYGCAGAHEASIREGDVVRLLPRPCTSFAAAPLALPQGPFDSLNLRFSFDLVADTGGASPPAGCGQAPA